MWNLNLEVYGMIDEWINEGGGGVGYLIYFCFRLFEDWSILLVIII